MADIALECPYCRTQMAGFRGSHYMANARHMSTSYSFILQRGDCVLVKFNSISFSELHEWLTGKSSMRPLEPNDVQPKQAIPKAPQHTPDNARNYFLQGLDNLHRQNFDAAGIMFRKCRDAGLRHVHFEGRGTFQKRSDSLPDELGVTPAMKTWAHEIRELGNDAAHEEEPFTEAEARSLHSFTELFLTYAFTLPSMLEERESAEAPV